jgi:MFS family permease
MERVVVPILAKDEFGISSFALILSFIATFGFTKAILNMFSGRWSDKLGRKPILILGWLIGLPVPFILIYAQAWSLVVFANVLMGFNQAMTWTMTVTSKIDLVGQKNRGLALGINEFSGYIGQASGGVITGFLAASFGLRPYPFYFGLSSVLLGLVLSIALAKETKSHARYEASTVKNSSVPLKSFYGIFANTTWRNKTLFACSQAGLVEKFTDTLVWGLLPLLLALEGVNLLTVGLIAGSYQGVWGVSQLFTGTLSDRVGRKPPIVAGMWTMAVGVVLVAYGRTFLPWLLIASFVMGFGMALVYPVLLASVADVTHPDERGASLGVYRLWRDSGYGFGAIFIGIVADAFNMSIAFYFSAIILLGSGLLVFLLMRETKGR